ncbi:MAG TPA: ADOP family duplicated permease [Thermoanaerobaculia bacterium]|nr:ADOP family duplicated permease [Thermoanaerobaculia bacterium]
MRRSLVTFLRSTAMLRFVRPVLRTWRRSPGVAAAIVLVLGLGIGVAVATFGVVDAALLRPLPVPAEEDLLYVVLTQREKGGHFGASYHTFAAWRDRVRAFEAVAALRARAFAVGVPEGGGARVERVEGTEVSQGYFAALDTRPSRGRAFTAEDFAVAGEPVAIVGDGFWRERLAGDPAAIGRELVLDGVAHRVVGVMPPSAHEPNLGWRALWTPLRIDEASALLRPVWTFSVLGRLRKGATLEGARAELDTISRELEVEFPSSNLGWTALARPVREWIVEGIDAWFRVVLAAVGLVLLVACANASGLLLFHVHGRRRELAVRRALGAGRARLAVQLVAESMALATAGCALGLAVAWTLLRAVRTIAPVDLPGIELAVVDARLVVTAVATLVLAGAVTGAVPAFRGAAGENRLLQGLRRGGWERDRGRLGRVLVATQTAFAVVVVVGATLLGASLLRLRAVDPGFDAERLLTLRFELPSSETLAADKQARIARLEELVTEVAALPGVESVALAGIALPLADGQGSFEVFVEGQERGAGPATVVNAQYVTAGYFGTMGQTVNAGVTFEPGETWDSGHRVVVNETFAQRYYPGGERGAAAVGRSVEFGNGERAVIAGVVEDVRQLGLDREAAAEVYVAWGMAPLAQALLVRGDVLPSTLTRTVSDRLAALEPGIAIWEVRSGTELVASSYADRRFSTVLLAGFGALVLALTAFGVLALALQSTAALTREFALRVALGAGRGDLTRRVGAEALLPVGVGVVCGLGVSLGMGRFVASSLFEVSPYEPRALAGTALAFAVAAGLACLPPLRRAFRADPIAILREE